jgi:hypothetical protein
MPVKDDMQAMLEELKRRVYLAKGLQTVQEAALAMQVHPVTLRNWLRGKSMVRLETIEAIEAWVNEQEQKAHGTHP